MIGDFKYFSLNLPQNQLKVFKLFPWNQIYLKLCIEKWWWFDYEIFQVNKNIFQIFTSFFTLVEKVFVLFSCWVFEFIKHLLKGIHWNKIYHKNVMEVEIQMKIRTKLRKSHHKNIFLNFCDEKVDKKKNVFHV